MVKNYSNGKSVVDENGCCLIHNETEGKNAKFYAVVLKCGHVGIDYFMPIMFPIQATKETLNSRIDTIPRVKRDDKYHTLFQSQISYEEYMFINLANNFDRYLKSDELNEHNSLIMARRIHEPLKQKYEISKVERDNHHMSTNKIKCAEHYDEQYVLQRAFAPTKQGNRFIWPGNVNKKELMEEYLTQTCRYLAMPKKHEVLLTLYYQIFGENNRCEMTYKDGKLTYTEVDGTRTTLPLSEKMIAKIEGLEIKDDYSYKDEYNV